MEEAEEEAATRKTRRNDEEGEENNVKQKKNFCSSELFRGALPFFLPVALSKVSRTREHYFFN